MPPRILMPYGRRTSARVTPLGSVTEPEGHTAVLPGMPLPNELMTFHAPEPWGGSSPLEPQPATMGSGFTAKPSCNRFCPLIATLASADVSPKLGARNEFPQVPRMVRSSIGDQLKATFGLLVPPKSLYWSWRHDTSSSRRRMKGMAFASLKTGMFTWLNTAQTARRSAFTW